MKPEQLYQELKHLAEKIDLQVSEQNFRTTGIHVKSGYCKVRGKDHCIIDKHLRLNQKLEILGECLGMMSHEAIYVMPAVREYLERFRPAEKPKENQESEAGRTIT